MKALEAQQVYDMYTTAGQFNTAIGLYETVEEAEHFYLGDQWVGVKANGNPTPVTNFIRTIASFQKAKICTDTFAIHASAMNSTNKYSLGDVERVCDVINKQFASLVERNKVVKLFKEFVRDASIRGDACIYSYWNPDIETGQDAKGDIESEIIENTRVLFGNPNNRNVEKQPWIMLATRRPVDEVQREAKQNGQPTDVIRADTETYDNYYDSLSNNKCTLLIFFKRDPDTGHIWAQKCTQDATVMPMKDTGLHRYPVVWFPWEIVKDNYHGKSLVTQLIPNQITVNKMNALMVRHLQTSAFPKTIYDGTRIDHWDAGVGKAIKVKTGGDINTVAKNLDAAMISPQVPLFIDNFLATTKDLSGASDAALGNTRPDNTSAIIALQRAADAPLDDQKQSVYEAVEDLAYIYLDMMREYYGTRYAQVKMLSKDQLVNQPLGMTLPEQDFNLPFDFGILNELPLSIKVDVGTSTYWSEIASVQTLDNLLQLQVISLDEYLERIPDAYIAKKQELIDKRRGMGQQPMMGASQPSVPMGTEMINTNQPIPIEGGGGYNAVARSLNETGMA